MALSRPQQCIYNHNKFLEFELDLIKLRKLMMKQLVFIDHHSVKELTYLIDSFFHARDLAFGDYRVFYRMKEFWLIEIALLQNCDINKVNIGLLVINFFSVKLPHSATYMNRRFITILINIGVELESHVILNFCKEFLTTEQKQQLQQFQTERPGIYNIKHMFSTPISTLTPQHNLALVPAPAPASTSTHAPTPAPAPDTDVFKLIESVPNSPVPTPRRSESDRLKQLDKELRNKRRRVKLERHERKRERSIERRPFGRR